MDSTEPGRPEQRVGATLSARFSRTNDIDEQASLLRGWNQTYNQVSAGAFAGSLLEAHFGPLYVFREQTGNCLFQTGALPEGTYALGIPFFLDGAATFCGQPCDGGQLHVFSGDDLFEFHSPRGLVMSGIVLPHEALHARFFGDEQDHALDTLAHPGLRAIDMQRLQELRELIDRLFRIAMSGTSAHLATAPALAENLMTALTGAIVDLSVHIAPDIPASRRWRVVRHVRELVHDGPDQRLSIDDLCLELGMSRRALQYCFEDTLGINPTTYLRAVRLDGARRSIKRGTNVTEAATEWGFWHFGRFAQAYRAMFEELPSDTYRRHHPGRSPLT